MKKISTVAGKQIRKQLRTGFQLPRLQTNQTEQDQLHVERRNAAPSILRRES
jgi:hypothetical protein